MSISHDVIAHIRTSLRIILAVSARILILGAVCLFLLSHCTPIVRCFLVVILQQRFKVHRHHHFFDCFYSFLSESTISEIITNKKFSVEQKENNLRNTPFLLIPRNSALFLSVFRTTMIALNRSLGKQLRLPFANRIVASSVTRIKQRR